MARRNRSDLIEVFKMFKRLSAVAFESLFVRCDCLRIEGRAAEVIKCRCQLDLRCVFFISEGKGNRWNALDQASVYQQTLNGLKNCWIKWAVKCFFGGQPVRLAQHLPYWAGDDFSLCWISSQPGAVARCVLPGELYSLFNYKIDEKKCPQYFANWVHSATAQSSCGSS